MGFWLRPRIFICGSVRFLIGSQGRGFGITDGLIDGGLAVSGGRQIFMGGIVRGLVDGDFGFVELLVVVSANILPCSSYQA